MAVTSVDRLHFAAGVRFGRLVVVAADDRKRYYLRCRCDCGAEAIVRVYDVRNKVTKSCGCLRREISSASIADARKHRKGLIDGR